MTEARVGQGIVVLGLSDQAAKWLADHEQERACLDRFVSMMVEELAANDPKGNRPGWLQMNRKEAMAEIGWHLAKLQVAAKAFECDEREGGTVIRGPNFNVADEAREYAADVANCSLMALDCLALLRADLKADATPPKTDPGSGDVAK